jgi:hypothetical protein
MSSDLLFMNELNERRPVVRLLNGWKVELDLRERAKAADTTGRSLWPSGIVLANYLLVLKNAGEVRSCLELGAGAARLPSIVAERMCKWKAISTDMVRSGNNKLLDWNNPTDGDVDFAEKIDIILASDVLYNKKNYVPFLQTLRLFGKTNEDIKVYLCYQPRKINEENFFFDKLLAENGIEYEEIENPFENCNLEGTTLTYAHIHYTKICKLWFSKICDVDKNVGIYL